LIIFLNKTWHLFIYMFRAICFYCYHNNLTRTRLHDNWTWRVEKTNWPNLDDNANNIYYRMYISYCIHACACRYVYIYIIYNYYNKRLMSFRRNKSRLIETHETLKLYLYKCTPFAFVIHTHIHETRHIVRIINVVISATRIYVNIYQIERFEETTYVFPELDG